MRKNIPFILSLPGLLLATLLMIFPVIYNVYLSLHENKSFGGEWVWVGIDNYLLLSGDETFIAAFKNGLIYATSSVFFQIALGLFFALYLNSKIKPANKRLFSSILIFPYLVPTALVVILWKWILSTEGILNFLLGNILHITQNEVDFLSEGLAMPVLVFISVWQFFSTLR